MGSGGKGSDGSGVTTYDYYGTIAFVVRAGPMDAIRMVMADQVAIWEGPIRRTDPGVGNPYNLTLTDPKWLLPGGYARLYWGDDDQIVSDPNLPGHPPYRGMTVLVLHKFLFGRERTSVPNIEVIGEARPRPPAAVIAATELDADGQANIWAILAEFLTSIHGAALAATALDAASWQAAHDYFGGTAQRRAMSYCSPLLTDQVDGAEFVARLCALCDGWVAPRSWSGLALRVRLWWRAILLISPR